MSPEARRHLLDRMRHGAAGFAAELSWKTRVLQGLFDLRQVVVAALGGKPGKAPGAFDLFPEERRYFDRAERSAESRKAETVAMLNKMTRGG